MEHGAWPEKSGFDSIAADKGTRRQRIHVNKKDFGQRSGQMNATLIFVDNLKTKAL